MSNSISMSLNYLRVREAFIRSPQVMERVIEVKLSRGAEEVARDAKRRAPKAFSHLVNSIRAERVGALHYQVAEGMNYGRSVEEGARPHEVNSRVLRPWVERVLGLRDKEARAAAFLIARAIKRRGTRAQPYMQPAAEANRSRLFELVNQGVAAGLKEVFG
jgi:hypothetical protein